MKAMFFGVAVAAMLGLGAGAIMKPTLRLAGMEGPQMLAPVSGRRAIPLAEDYLVAWNGPPPDYVVGTDALRGFAYPELQPDPEPGPVAFIELPVSDPPIRVAVAPAYETSQVRVSIPSVDGDTLAVVLPPPPTEPQSEGDDVEPPEA